LEAIGKSGKGDSWIEGGDPTGEAGAIQRWARFQLTAVSKRPERSEEYSGAPVASNDTRGRLSVSAVLSIMALLASRGCDSKDGFGELWPYPLWSCEGGRVVGGTQDLCASGLETGDAQPPSSRRFSVSMQEHCNDVFAADTMPRPIKEGMLDASGWSIEACNQRHARLGLGSSHAVWWQYICCCSRRSSASFFCAPTSLFCSGVLNQHAVERK
jgi:hypothetical protein